MSSVASLAQKCLVTQHRGVLKNAATCLELEVLLSYLSKAVGYPKLAECLTPFSKFALILLSKQM